jgi:hypothetical protein
VLIRLKKLVVMAFTVTAGTVTSIRSLAAPARLGQLVPSWVA